MLLGLQAIASSLEAIALRLETIAIRLEGRAAFKQCIGDVRLLEPSRLGNKHLAQKYKRLKMLGPLGPLISCLVGTAAWPDGKTTGKALLAIWGLDVIEPHVAHPLIC